MYLHHPILPSYLSISKRQLTVYEICSDDQQCDIQLITQTYIVNVEYREEKEARQAFCAVSAASMEDRFIVNGNTVYAKPTRHRHVRWPAITINSKTGMS